MKVKDGAQAQWQTWATRGFAVAIAVAASFLFTLHTSPAIQQPARADPREGSNRIWFPAAKPAEFVLPDGSKRSVRSMLAARKTLAYGDFLWDDFGVPPGPIWVRVDLPRQLISAFVGDQEVGSAVILYGTDGKPTPVGLFHVTERARDHVSNLYDAPMPFMMRLTDDGVAIHASPVRYGSATHGCVGVPIGFAEHLFSRIRVGDPVIIVGNDKPGTGEAAG